MLHLLGKPNTFLASATRRLMLLGEGGAGGRASAPTLGLGCIVA
jgi:hypothetical protein